MKRKRLFSAIAATAMAGVMGIALTACGGSNSENTGGNGGGADISTVLTEAQWDAAFGIDNFKKDAKIVYEQTLKKQSMSCTLTLGGTECGSHSIVSVSTDNGSKTRESSTIVIVGDEYSNTNYSKESELYNGVWKEGEWSSNISDKYDYAANNNKLWLDYVLDRVEYDYLVKIADEYNNFTYKTDKFEYKGNGVTLMEIEESDEDAVYKASITATAITVTITDNKLTEVSMTCKGVEITKVPSEDIDETEELDMSISYKITYGAQTVEAPTDATPRD